MLFRLVIPLIFFVIFDAVLSYFVTLHYVDEAYDRWLLDSARSLTQEIKVRGGKVFVELPAAALEIFKWDEQDKTYFKISSSEQEILAGDKLVPEPLDPETEWSHPVYFNDTMYGEPVRVVSMLITLDTTSEKILSDPGSIIARALVPCISFWTNFPCPNPFVTKARLPLISKNDSTMLDCWN